MDRQKIQTSALYGKFAAPSQTCAAPATPEDPEDPEDADEDADEEEDPGEDDTEEIDL